jgi:hypothetical protein
MRKNTCPFKNDCGLGGGCESVRKECGRAANEAREQQRRNRKKRKAA